MKADILAGDRGELVSLMEPTHLGESYRHRNRLMDLAIDLAQKSEGFRRSLPPSLTPSLASLVRSMNCYYSNLIEGHDTHPIDIERALQADYSEDVRKRDLQLEARAHITVQQWIDEGGLSGSAALTGEGLCEIHRRFYQLLPDELKWVEDPATKERRQVEPGSLRLHDVRVGQHVAISPGAIPRFLERFAQVYGRTGKAEALLALAAAHHRILWIHPFLDGNGRVSRLMSHAQMLEVLNTGAVWSVARGLARNVADYKRLLANCDQARPNDLEALGQFTDFFLRVCIDEVDSLEGLLQPDRLRARILNWADQEYRLGRLPGNAAAILEAILFRGELPRGDADTILRTGERQARRVVSALLDTGALVSDGPRAPLRLAFPAILAAHWMPGLFPDHSR